jgi:hypothetical protein
MGHKQLRRWSERARSLLLPGGSYLGYTGCQTDAVVTTAHDPKLKSSVAV